MTVSRGLRLGLGILLISAAAGCAQSRTRRTLAASEPPLITDGEDVTTVVEAPKARASATVADRHPMLRRPREYYDKTNGGKATKTAAAAVLGVPSGIVAEMRQAISGQPAPR